VHYCDGINHAARAIINVSVWDTLEHAEQMASPKEMQAEGTLMRSKGVRFEPIDYESDHTLAWLRQGRPSWKPSELPGLCRSSWSRPDVAPPTNV